MGQLTTHVLDTMHGCPAAGMALSLWREGENVPLRTLALDADGRAGGPLLMGESFRTGRYRLHFGVAAYFRSLGVALPEPPFLDEVVLAFGIADEGAHYHVPLLASPWAYSTYRGS
jgi:5-hydroxyisourate hydrolase